MIKHWWISATLFPRVTLGMNFKIKPEYSSARGFLTVKVFFVQTIFSAACETFILNLLNAKTVKNIAHCLKSGPFFNPFGLMHGRNSNFPLNASHTMNYSFLIKVTV